MDIQLEDLPRAMPIQTYTGGLTHPVSAVGVVESSDTQQLLLAACDKNLVVMDLVTNQVLRRLQGHVGRINALAAADKGEAYLSAGYDGTVCIWDGRSSRDYKPIQVLKEAKDSVTDLYVVPPNASGGGSAAAMGMIRTASVDGMVRTYDLRMGVLKNDNCHSSITSMAPTYDGQCMAISCLDGTIRLMELETGELLNTYQGAHKAGQYGLGVAILADDATIVSGSEDGHCVCYDLVRATCVQSLQTLTQSQGSPRRPTCAIAAHPKQSSVVITTSYDESAIVWAYDAAVWKNQMFQE
jgi:mitogen-activated protein kinase organizer 1